MPEPKPAFFSELVESQASMGHASRSRILQSILVQQTETDDAIGQRRPGVHDHAEPVITHSQPTQALEPTDRPLDHPADLAQATAMRRPPTLRAADGWCGRSSPTPRGRPPIECRRSGRTRSPGGRWGARPGADLPWARRAVPVVGDGWIPRNPPRTCSKSCSRICGIYGNPVIPVKCRIT